MGIASLQIMHASVATARCCFLGSLVNEFEKVSSVGHQISVADGEGAVAGGGGSQVWFGEGGWPEGPVQWDPRHHG